MGLHLKDVLKRIKDKFNARSEMDKIIEKANYTDEVGKMANIIKMQSQVIYQYKNAEIFSEEQIKTIEDAIEMAKEESYKKGYEDGKKSKETE